MATKIAQPMKAIFGLNNETPMNAIEAAKIVR